MVDAMHYLGNQLGVHDATCSREPQYVLVPDVKADALAEPIGHDAVVRTDERITVKFDTVGARGPTGHIQWHCPLCDSDGVVELDTMVDLGTLDSVQAAIPLRVDPVV